MEIRKSLRYCVVAAFALGFAAVANTAYAQGAVISGKVTNDQGRDIAGANVIIPELNISVATNPAGNYTIVVPTARLNGATTSLRVRAIGYIPKASTVTLSAGAQTANFSLEQDINRLEAVVTTGVTGATVATKLPFSVSRIDSADMMVPATNPLSQLAGKVPGASIVSASGRPGASPSVLLRGPTAITGAGRGQSPLYIVDGVILADQGSSTGGGGLPDLNPQDIESVEVVKGAAASSLYGSRAGNGVIQIVTKSGKNTSDGIRFSSRYEFGGGDIENEYHWAHAHTMVMTEDGKRFCVSGTNCSISVDFYDEARRVNEDAGDFALGPVNFERDMGIGAAPTRPRLRGTFMVGQWPVAYNPIAQTVTNGLNSNATIDATGRVRG